MADRMMRAQLAALTTALLLCSGGNAQPLTDPTRPPLELMSTAAAGASPRTPLQSILLSSTRKGAIINGQYVPLGGNYGKARLIRITATEVTLKGDGAMEVLQLYPPMETISAATGAEGKPEKAGRRP